MIGFFLIYLPERERRREGGRKGGSQRREMVKGPSLFQGARGHDLGDEDDLLPLAVHPGVVIFDHIRMLQIFQ
jgi:hypothetical protein